MNQKTIILKPNKAVNAILSIDGKPLGGQKNCTLNRTMKPIDITNKINGDWNTSLAGLKGWSINCTGMFIKDEESFDILEKAFYNGTAVDVKITDDNRTYAGSALITNFPINLNYNDTFIYNITLLGTGELT